jgi:hypothetical protein
MNHPILRLEFQTEFDESFHCPRLHVGKSYENGLKVDYVTILYRDDQPALQVGAYVNPSEEFDFTSWSCLWKGWLVSGFGNSIVFIHPESHATHLFDLAKSFGLTSHFLMMESTDDYLIGVTSCGLIRFHETAEIIWVADDLGTEGVFIDKIEDGKIQGIGKWSMMLDWTPFEVDFTTGTNITSHKPPE